MIRIRIDTSKKEPDPALFAYGNSIFRYLFDIMEFIPDKED